MNDAIRRGLRAAFIEGYERGLRRAGLINFYVYHGQYFLMGDGVMAATTCRTESDVEDFNRRYAAAKTDGEQRAVIKSIIDWSVQTR